MSATIDLRPLSRASSVGGIDDAGASTSARSSGVASDAGGSSTSGSGAYDSSCLSVWTRLMGFADQPHRFNDQVGTCGGIHIKIAKIGLLFQYILCSIASCFLSLSSFSIPKSSLGLAIAISLCHIAPFADADHAIDRTAVPFTHRPVCLSRHHSRLFHLNVHLGRCLLQVGRRHVEKRDVSHALDVRFPLDHSA
jgi:hypothetical protein